MARLPYPDPADRPESVRRSLGSLPARLNVFEMLANSPTTVEHVVSLGEALLSKLEVPAAQREMTILWVGRRTGAEYTWAHHLRAARAAGVTEAQIEAVRDLAPLRDCLNPAQAAALTLADRIAQGAPSTGADIARLSAHYSVRQIVELTVLASYYLMIARILTTLDIDLDTQGAGVADT